MSDISTGTAAPAASTPAAPSETGASSSPATTSASAPSSPSTPAERPRSMQEALQRAAAAPAAATPDASPAAAATAAPATEAPADPTKPPVVDPTTPPASEKGPIPFDRHKTALDNARKKAAEDARTQFVQEYGGSLQVLQQIRTNPDAAIPQLYAEWRASKGLGPELDASDAARMLASRRGQAQADAMPSPDLVGTDASGNRVSMFSADSLVQALQRQREELLAEVEQRFGPIQQEFAQTKAEKQQQARLEQVRGEVGGKLAQWRKAPGFAEHETEIKQRQAELSEAGMDPWSALGLAYAEIVPSRLQTQTQASTQQSLMQQAAAKVAGSVSNPGHVAPAPPRRPRSFSEALRQQASGA